jgi:NTE family protein
VDGRLIALLTVCVLALPAQPQAIDQNQTPAPPSRQPAKAGNAPDNDKPVSATGQRVRVSPLAPAPAPPRTFARPRIGLALGGGGALGLTEIGALEWLEEHHIPVDVIAGTSMGCMVSALYSSGQSPQDLVHVMNDTVFTSVFSFSNAYTSRSFRRREESRELPNALTVGLKHHVSLRNALLTDQGLNAFLAREFLRYNDQTEFNRMPIPLRCVATDLNTADAATFAHGSLANAVRASVSIPGVFSPFELNGHEFVDGGVVENLPTPTVHAMGADVVLAVSIPIAPVSAGDLDSLFGVVGRAASVAINVSEKQLRKQADVVMIPDISGYGVGDYLKAPELAKRGYAAAEAHKAELLKYAVSAADWQAYLAHRQALIPGAPAPVLRVRVDAPTRSARDAIQKLFAPLVNQPVDTHKIEAALDQVRADGRYEANYTVGYETEPRLNAEQAAPEGTIAVPVATTTEQLAANTENGAQPLPRKQGKALDENRTPAQGQQPGSLADRPGAQGLANTQALTDASLADLPRRPVVLVTVKDKTTGPPFLLLGANLQAQTGGITRATVEGILIDQDLGSYGAELRSHFRVGYLTDLSTEYYRPFLTMKHETLFAAPRGQVLRQPFPIFNNTDSTSSGIRLSTREFQLFSTGGDLGLTDQHTQELRAGFDFAHIDWTTQIGADTLPDVHGTSSRARLWYSFDTEDRALVPQFGVHLVTEFAYLFNTVASPDTPELSGSLTYSHRFAFRPEDRQNDTGPKKKKGGEIMAVEVEGGTLFNHAVAQPFRYTLGGPLRLSASTIDQYRGTEYFLVEPALLKRIAQLPAPLGQSIYIGGSYEFAKVFAPDAATIARQDFFFGLVAETPLGVITVGPALGDNHEHKLIFTLGRLF